MVTDFTQNGSGLFFPSGVIFDFDGVLVDSLKAHVQAWMVSCEELFSAKIDPFPEELIGLATPSIAARLASHFGKSHLVRQLIDLKRQHLLSGKIPIPLLPGAKEAVQRLERLGIPFAIGSNASRPFIDYCLQLHGWQFERVISLDDGHPPKPAPECFLACARLMGVPFTEHHRVLVFEDSLHGIKAAKRAGMVGVGLMTQHDHAGLRGGGATHVCQDLAEALKQQIIPAERQGS